MGRKEALSPEPPLSPGDYQHAGSAHVPRFAPPGFGTLRESIQRSPRGGGVSRGGGGVLFFVGAFESPAGFSALRLHISGG